MENEVDRSELLRRIEHSYKRFDERLSRAVLHDVEASGVCGVLSVKDLVAHLTAHEQRTLDELRAAREGHTLAIKHEEMDSFNDGAVYAYRAATFDTVRRQWRRSYASVVQAINALNDADFDPQSDFVRALTTPSTVRSPTTLMPTMMRIGNKLRRGSSFKKKRVTKPRPVLDHR